MSKFELEQQLLQEMITHYLIAFKEDGRLYCCLHKAIYLRGIFESSKTLSVIDKLKKRGA